MALFLTRPRSHPNAGGLIRTIGVSLLAIAAIAASVGVAVNRLRQGPVTTTKELDEKVIQPSVRLEALRAAGF